MRPSLQDACLWARVGCGAVSLRLEVIEELHDLPEAMEIKQWWWARRGLRIGKLNGIFAPVSAGAPRCPAPCACRSAR